MASLAVFTRGGENPMVHQPVLSQLNLVVRDMQAAVAFYRRLGLPIERTPPPRTPRRIFPTGS
jgi:hypothetical protein